MKARLFTLAMIITFSVTNIFAGQPPKMITNMLYTDSGSVKQCILINDEWRENRNRVDYSYDKQGVMQQRVAYIWHNQKGWISIHKVEYRYTSDKQLDLMVYTKWDSKTKNWSENSQKTEYIGTPNRHLFVGNTVWNK